MSPQEREFSKIQWQTEGKGTLGGHSEVAIPPGYQFTSGAGTRTMLKLSGNIPSGRELGMLCTQGDLENWVLFEFDDCGYVKDDEKDDLDAGAMLASLREGQEQANKQRKAQHLPELELTGWQMPPKYNEATHNLEWAPLIKNKESGNVSVNYNTRLLGREGVMEVTLLCPPEALKAALPAFQNIIDGHQYLAGKSYAEYRQGDRLASYGLAALVLGGAGIGAAKMGWLAKFGVFFAKLGKAAYLLVLGVIVGIKKFFARLFGRGQQA